jgi:chorismate mutase
MTWIETEKKPYVIAGPCSAESEEQLNRVVQEISTNSHVKAIRAGIWKPRTKPNSFEGLGEQALPWLVNAGKRHGLPVITEVANPEHVELALKHGVDMIWIGARTTVNPFTVQAIADSLKGIKIPVMVKNPVNPDLQLWLGSIERIEGAGIDKIAAIHRGFSYYGEHVYRNVPQWEIPIEFKRLRPDLPIICDPSHIAGKRALLLEIAQRAMDLNFDGLMIETHPNPDHALSDAKQQITPEDLSNLLKNLQIRSTKTDNPDYYEKLHSLRNRIDTVDDGLFNLFEKRLQIAREIGNYKKDSGVTILSLERWDQIITDRIKQAEDKGLNPHFVKRILELIHKESIRIQNDVMNR